MTTGYSAALRNAQLAAITTTIGPAGILQIYSGMQPATGGVIGAQVLLASFTLGSPFAPAAVAGMLSPTIPAATTGTAASGGGTIATWFRILTSGSVQVLDGTVGTAAADLILNTTTISSGVAVAISSFTITRGNP